jgi:hypothetical protein
MLNRISTGSMHRISTDSMQRILTDSMQRIHPTMIYAINEGFIDFSDINRLNVL